MSYSGRFALTLILLWAPPSLGTAQPSAVETAAEAPAAPVETIHERIDVTAGQTEAEAEKRRAATPGGVSLVDSTEANERSVTGLAELLRYVPGIWAESAFGGDELFLSSRGSNLDATDYDKNGIKLLQDGLPVTTADGNNHNRVIDPLSARYVTVARGANAFTYGASTLGGAIDFTSPTARNSAPLALWLDGGSHGSLNGRATAGFSGTALDGLFTAETRQWDGYRDHSSQERWGIYANGGWQASDRASLRLFATYVDNDQNLPGALTRAEVFADPDQASAAALEGNYSKGVKTGRLAAKSSWTLASGASLLAGFSYEEQSLFHPIVNRILVDFDGPGPNPPFEVFSLLIDTDHRDLGAMVRYDHNFGKHELQMGLNYGDGSVEGGNYRNLGGQPNGLRERVDNAAQNTELFLVDHWRLTDRFTVVLGAQAVNAERDVQTTNVATGAVDQPNDRYSAINPRIGLLLALGDSGQLYGNVSRLFEAPTTFEMEDDVRGGNATLDPMSGLVAEFGWRGALRQTNGTRWDWEVSAYYAQIRDEILSLDDPAAPGNSLTTNIDQTLHAGLEAQVRARFAIGRSHQLESRLSATIHRFRFDGDPTYGNNRLPAAPRHVLRGELLFRHAGGFFAGPTFDLVGERYVDFANTYLLGSYELLGVRAGFTGDRWELFGELRNLLDENYVATLSVLNVAPADARVLNPGSPRSFYAGLRYNF